MWRTLQRGVHLVAACEASNGSSRDVGVQPRIDTFGMRQASHVFGAVALHDASFTSRFRELDLLLKVWRLPWRQAERLLQRTPRALPDAVASPAGVPFWPALFVFSYAGNSVWARDLHRP